MRGGEEVGREEKREKVEKEVKRASRRAAQERRDEGEVKVWREGECKNSNATKGHKKVLTRLKNTVVALAVIMICQIAELKGKQRMKDSSMGRRGEREVEVEGERGKNKEEKRRERTREGMSIVGSTITKVKKG